MKHINTTKQFWTKMVSGEKKYLIVPVEKGLPTGTREFVSIECEKILLQDGSYIHNLRKPKEIYGTAHLKPIAVNPIIYDDQFPAKFALLSNVADRIVWTWLEIEKETYDFVKENYIDKGIDFMAYEISDVKENK